LEYHHYKVENLDLYKKIPINHYSASEPSQYMKVDVPTTTLARRFKVTDLEQLYREMRYYSFEEYLDGQTFIHLIVLSMKENRVPNAWRFFDFSTFNNIVKRFKITPLGHENAHSSHFSVGNIDGK
jgi:hypothetical protein